MDMYNEVPAYVYKHTNIITGEYYFGYRFYNTRLNIMPEDDLPNYICSAKLKERILEERNLWNSKVLEVFYGENKKTEAYWKEQEYIKAHLGDDLMINKIYYDKDTHKGMLVCNSHSEETRKKISDTLKRTKVFSEETRKKISQAKLGHGFTDEAKNKIRNSLKGNIPWNKGKKLGPQSEEVRKKTSEAVTKWWAERKNGNIKKQGI